MNISQAIFGDLPNGDKASLFTLTNNSTTVKITNFGGIITSILTKAANGNLDDIVLGYDELAPYLQNPCYFGAITGRFTGRINKGLIKLNEQDIQLTCNSDNSQLHGGENGLHKQLWQAETKISSEKVSLILTHKSPAGCEGFPGNLSVKAIYSLSADNTLSVEYLAKTDQVTFVNMSQHSYFNLAGHNHLKRLAELVSTNTQPSYHNLAQQHLTFNAQQYFPMHDNGYPTGELKHVKNTVFDFTHAKEITANFPKQKDNYSTNNARHSIDGYDHYFLLNPHSEHVKYYGDQDARCALAARVYDKQSGRRMSVYTNQKSMVFYTGNFLDGSQLGKQQTHYSQYAGFCLEPVNCINETTTIENKALFTPSIITPYTPFHSISHFVFDTLKADNA